MNALPHTPPPQPLGTILAAVGFSAASRDALAQAGRLAAGNGGRGGGTTDLRVLHVVPAEATESFIMDWPTANDKEEARMAAVARRDLDGMLIQVLPSRPLHGNVTVGSPVRETLRAVKASHADLLVMGLTEHPDRPGAGTLASACLRKAPTKVLLVRPGHTGPFRTIVAGVDFSDTSRRALVQAFRMARQDGAAVHALHAFCGPWRDPFYRVPAPEAVPDIVRRYKDDLLRRLEAFVAESSDDARAANTTCCVVDGPSHGEVLAQYAREHDADLIVMGTRGRTNLRYVLLGSTAERIVREAPCSILAVKPEEFSIDID